MSHPLDVLTQVSKELDRCFKRLPESFRPRLREIERSLVESVSITDVKGCLIALQSLRRLK